MVFYIHALPIPASHFIEKCYFNGSLSSGPHFIDHFLYRMAIRSPPGIWKEDADEFCNEDDFRRRFSSDSFNQEAKIK